MFVGIWNNYSVAVMRLRNPQFYDDFHHGLNMLRQLQSSGLVTQLLGECTQQSVFVCEYHRLSSADHLIDVLHNDNSTLSLYDSASLRMSFCYDYVEIIAMIHGNSRVFCDSNSLAKTLQQFLVTSRLHLVVNDLDALPLIISDTPGAAGIKCGHREIFDDDDDEFVAPEQLWPYDTPFDDSLMPTYDEKVDIWKIPNVCLHFLRDRTDCNWIVYKLFRIHNSCKHNNPSLRPSAHDVLDEYKQIFNELYYN